MIEGARGQVQQCNAHDNVDGIIAVGDNCLITMNTANFNADVGIATGGNKCTISFNTTSNNHVGILAGVGWHEGTGYLVTQNVALNNGAFDFGIACPSDVTYNMSSGAPSSYVFSGTGCHLVNNDDPPRLGARGEGRRASCPAPGTVARSAEGSQLQLEGHVRTFDGSTPDSVGSGPQLILGQGGVPCD